MAAQAVRGALDFRGQDSRLPEGGFGQRSVQDRLGAAVFVGQDNLGHVQALIQGFSAVSRDGSGEGDRHGRQPHLGEGAFRLRRQRHSSGNLLQRDIEEMVAAFGGIAVLIDREQLEGEKISGLHGLGAAAHEVDQIAVLGFCGFHQSSVAGAA